MTIPEQQQAGATATPAKCNACRDGEAELFPFSMAFQPIVDVTSQTVFAYEALVRGPNQESAASILNQVTPENLYAFDQGCRVRAIELAAKLGIHRQGARLSVNFKPGAVYSPAACIRRTLRAAAETGFPLDQLIFEITEDERVSDTAHLQQIVTEYQKHGFGLALDDFGAGFSGLNLLSELAVNYVKLDGGLIRNLHNRPRAQAIVCSATALAREIGAQVIGESVETLEEYRALHNCGVPLMQGYLFARPQFEALPEITWPEAGSHR
jgi:EAL domain-containing protein (putative c-di-GMP-specific phosphodiesterase class I)